MKHLTYLAVLTPTKTGYSIYFPDVPGCISLSEDIENGAKNAKEALELHYYGTVKDEEEFPQPTNQLSQEDTQGSLVCPITIYPDLVMDKYRKRKVKTNCVLPAWIKEIAEYNNINYFQVLENALKEKFNLFQEV